MSQVLEKSSLCRCEIIEFVSRYCEQSIRQQQERWHEIADQRRANDGEFDQAVKSLHRGKLQVEADNCEYCLRGCGAFLDFLNCCDERGWEGSVLNVDDGFESVIWVIVPCCDGVDALKLEELSKEELGISILVFGLDCQILRKVVAKNPKPVVGLTIEIKVANEPTLQWVIRGFYS